MKNFLKSTAIFACIALMFAACSEDSTEDAAAGVSVPAPVIESIQPGKGTIALKWYIPDDCDANKSMITWKNLDAATTVDDGVTNEFVREGMSHTYTIGKDHPLSAVGNYEVSITNIHASSLTRSEKVTQTVLVYTDAIYASSLPTPSSYSYDRATGVTIYWSDIDADCQGVVVTYTYVDIDGNDRQKSTELMPLTDGTTVIADAKIGTDFTFSGFFCPEGAVDMVEVKGGEGSISSTPSGVTKIDVTSGKERFLVEWSLSKEVLADNLEAMLVTFVNSKKDKFEYRITTEEMTFEANNKCYVEAPFGTYTVSICSVKEGDFRSDATAFDSPVVVYNDDSFELPTISTIENSNSSEVTISWFEAPAGCESWYIKYQMADGEMSGAIPVVLDGGVAENTVFTDAKELGVIEIYATYRPEGALDYVYLEAEAEESIPVAAAATPVLLQPKTSYTVDGESEITLTWSVDDPDGLASSVIYFADNSVEPLKYTEIELMNPLRGDNTYTLAAKDGIKTSTEYNVYVKVKRDNSDATLSAASESFDVLAYNANEFTLADIPIPSAVLDETLFVTGATDEIKACNAKIVWSCDKIDYVVSAVIEYDGEEYTSIDEYDADGNRSVVTYFPVTDMSIVDYKYVSVDFYPTGGVETVTVPYTGSAIPTIAMNDPQGVAIADVKVIPVFEQVETEFGETATGTSKFKVEWITDAIVDHFEVAYGESEVLSNKKSIVYAADEYSEIIEDDSAEANTLPKFKYTMFFDCGITDGVAYGATVQSVSKLGRTALATAELSANAYGVTTFAQAPVVKSISVSNGGDGSANLKWEDSVEGLKSVVVTYLKNSGAYGEVEAKIDGSEIEITVLPDAKLDKTIEYVSTFCPKGAEGDIVYKTTSTETVNATNNPYVPVSIKLNSFGYTAESNKPYVNLAWTPSADYPVAQVYYVYYSNDGECPDDENFALETTVSACKLEFADNETGNYTVYVKSATYNTDPETMTETPVFLSDEYIEIPVFAYNTTSYSEANLPAVLASCDDDGVVSVEWKEVSKEIKSVTATYNDVVVINGAAITEGQMSTFIYAEGVSTFTYVAEFVPAGGADVVAVKGSASFADTDSDIEWDAEKNAYVIYTAKGLAAFADIVNGTTKYLSDATLVVADTFAPATTTKNSAANGIVADHIDLSTVCSTTAGTWPSMLNYTGVFNGGYFVISNLYINATVGNQGLFGTIKGATVKNVKLQNPLINVTGGTVGGVVGSATAASLVENCTVYGSYLELGENTTNFDIQATGTNVGGIVGVATTGSTVIGCVNESVKVYNGVAAGAASGIAGVVGTVNASYVINCHNNGSVNISFDDTKGVGGVGGAAGYVTGGYVVGCSNSGTVQGRNYSGSVGGYFVESSCAIGCYSTGNIYSFHGMGGIVGRPAGSSIYGSFGTGAIYKAGSVFGGLAGNTDAGTSIDRSFYVPSTMKNTTYTAANGGIAYSTEYAPTSITGASAGTFTGCSKVASTSALNTSTYVNKMNASIAVGLEIVNASMLEAGAAYQISNCAFAVGVSGLPELSVEVK